MGRLLRATTLEQVALSVIGGAHQRSALHMAEALVQGYLTKLGKAVGMHILLHGIVTTGGLEVLT